MSAATTLKRSRQRDAILAFLKTRKDHPTADTVYMSVREEFPNISLGTVYRNLTLLTDLGMIQKLSMGAGVPDRFDATIWLIQNITEQEEENHLLPECI